MSNVVNNGVAIIDHLLNEIATQESFVKYAVTKNPSDCITNGFAGIVTCITITGTLPQGELKCLNLIVKSVPKGYNIEILYNREIFMYEEIFPLLVKLDGSQGLSQSKLFPVYYKGHKSDTLILENLCSSGYKLHDKRTPMDHSHVSLVMKEYGHFHALCFALKQQNPDVLACVDDVYIKFLKSTGLIKAMVTKCAKCSEAIDQTDEHSQEVYRKFVASVLNFIDNLPHSVDKYSVLLHGDCWSTNILFKYADENSNSIPTQVSFIDFQLSRLGSPVLDLSNFFYGCSSKEVINNLQYYMDVYYDSLSCHLEQLGHSSNLIYPLAVFHKHWKDFSKIGLIRSMLILHSSLADKPPHNRYIEAMLDEGDLSNVYNYSIGNIVEYNDRIKHNILHFVQNNFI